MKISREILGQEVQISLTDNELYLAHREYLCKVYEADVEEFLNLVDVPEVKVLEGKVSEMASAFYDIKIHNEYTDDYAMANAVLPMLDEMEISYSYDIEYFESTSHLNCI